MGFIKDVTMGALLFSLIVVGVSIFTASLAEETGHTLSEDMGNLSVLNDINTQSQNLTDAINQQTLQGNVANILFSIPTAIFGFLKIIFSSLTNTITLVVLAGETYFHVPSVLIVIGIAGIGIAVGFAIVAAIAKVNL